MEYHDCGHHQDVTVECSMLETVLFILHHYFVSLAINTFFSNPSTTISSCDGATPTTSDATVAIFDNYTGWSSSMPA